MSSINKKLGEIRELINSPRKQYKLLKNKIAWNKLCSCLDTIGDTELAINRYRQKEHVDGYDGGYLYLYGLLQAIFLQQDAVNHLSEALFNKSINYKELYKALHEIREIRNDSIGHPTNRRGESFHVISRPSINKDGFELIKYFPEGEPEFIDINITEIIETQSKLVNEILGKIKNEIREEELEHKLKFKNKKLTDLIPDTLEYHISKLYECIHSHSENDIPLVKVELDCLLQVVKELEEGIKLRYESIDALPFVKSSIAKIKFIFTRLEKLYNSHQFKNNLESEVYIDSLSTEFKELAEVASSIDDVFKIE